MGNPAVAIALTAARRASWQALRTGGAPGRARAAADVLAAADCDREPGMAEVLAPIKYRRQMRPAVAERRMRA